MHDNGGGSKAERTPFLKLYTADWAEGTVGMTFEQEGFYLRLLMLMWARKAMLPHDLDELARHLRADRRVIRRLLSDLEALGKLVITETEIINERMKAEIGTREKQVKSATSRADFRRTSATSPAKVQEKSGGTQKSTQANSTTSAPTANPPIFQKSDTDTKNTPQPADTNSAAETGGLAGLERVKLLAEWLTPGHKLTGQALDIAAAQNLIASQVRDVGQVAVERAFVDVLAKLACGEPVGKPVKLWIAICRTHKGATAEPPKGAPKPIAPHLRELFERATKSGVFA